MARLTDIGLTGLLAAGLLAAALAPIPAGAQAGPGQAAPEQAASEQTPAAPAAGAAPAALPATRSVAGADEDLTLPPVIQAMPGDVRLAPPPEQGEDGLDVVVTGGQTDWRLPDLGTSLREEEETRDPDQRMEARLAPLFDPEKEDPTHETAPVVDVLRDVGFIRIFEIRIGPKNE